MNERLTSDTFVWLDKQELQLLSEAPYTSPGNVYDITEATSSDYHVALTHMLRPFTPLDISTKVSGRLLGKRPNFASLFDDVLDSRGWTSGREDDQRHQTETDGEQTKMRWIFPVPVLLMSWFGVEQVKANSCIRTGKAV
ncbi:hypothetical protein KGM_203590 [Danaus plexippus plexippus]|uniref:Uncharacterized protein n=1 Tax=Danaus plexippus plexippus TaxID=278856 RepID=A0A212EKY0_DANPL|nr:hypothetical protein KGM_203590 [Danaus plexippus plexippus]